MGGERVKVLIVEEALKGLHGHWFQYIGDICDGGKEAGHEIEVAVHKDASPEILTRFFCHPILGESVFGAEIKGGGLSGLCRMFRRNISLFLELRAHFKEGHHYDAVIATTPRIDHIYAHLLLNSIWAGKAYKQLILIFVESVGVYSQDFSSVHFGKKSLPLKWGMKLSCFLPGSKRIELATESEGLARQFRAFCGVTFAQVPHVTRWIESENDPVHRNGSKLILGTFGFTRYDKGVDVLQTALRRLQDVEQPEDTQFVIQWTGDFTLPDGTLVKRDPELEKRSDVIYLEPFTQPREFPDWLAKTDVMILPYRRHFYYDKLSRVAIDAAEAGIPMIYPQGTWLEEFVADYGAGVSFVPEDADSLSCAVTEIVKNHAQFKEAAVARAELAREHFSAKHFFEIIGGLPGMRK